MGPDMIEGASRSRQKAYHLTSQASVLLQGADVSPPGGDLKKAHFRNVLEHSVKAIAADETYAGGWVMKALALANLGDKEEAIKALQEVERLGPDNDDHERLYYLARAYGAVGNTKQAFKTLEAVCKAAKHSESDFENYKFRVNLDFEFSELWREKDFKDPFLTAND